jgi:hypothetical protein
MLPRPASYLAMDVLPYWQRLSHKLPQAFALHLQGIEWARGEHQMFMGLGVALLFLSGLGTLALRPCMARDLPAKSMLIALGVLVLATLSIKGHSAYAALALVPGFNAIRAVTRIITVLMFPVSVIAVLGIRGLSEQVAVGGFGKAAVAACISITAYEISQLPLAAMTFVPSEAQRRVDAIVAEATSARGALEAPILAYHGDDLVYTQLDAMFAAQQLGWPTVNGYSGNFPPGTTGTTNCVWMTRQLGNFDVWQRTRGAYGAMLPELLPRLVFIGWPECRPKVLPSFSVGSPPSIDLPKAVVVSPGATERRNDRLAFTVNIYNGGNELIPATSSASIRISWRFVDELDFNHAPGFELSEDIGIDIPPQSAAEAPVITAKLPVRPGLYRLQVTLMAVGIYWFQDKGMHVLTFPERFAVNAGEKL